MKISQIQMADIKKFCIKYILIIVLLLEVTIGSIISPSFLNTRNFQVILFACTLNGIISIGQSLALIAKEIDLSVGSNLVFSPVLAVYLTNLISIKLTGAGVLQGTSGYMLGGWGLVVVITIITATLVGFTNGLIVVKCHLPAFIATIGMQFFLKAMAYIISKGIPIFFKDIQSSVFIGNASIVGVFPISTLVFIAIGIFVVVLNSKTKFGMRLYATGGGLKASKLSGINTDRWKIIAFTLCGTMVGIASIMYMSRLQGIDITQSRGYDMNSIAISIIGGIALSGGKGSIAGTMQATAIISILINILNLMGLMAYYQMAITGAVIVGIAIMHKRTESKRFKMLKIIEV